MVKPQQELTRQVRPVVHSTPTPPVTSCSEIIEQRPSSIIVPSYDVAYALSTVQIFLLAEFSPDGANRDEERYVVALQMRNAHSADGSRSIKHDVTAEYSQWKRYGSQSRRCF